MKFNFKKMTSREKMVYGIIYAVIIIFAYYLTFSFAEDVPANKIVINQMPISGTLLYWTTPGTKAQWFGTTTEYEKSFQIWFSDKEEQGDEYDEAINVVFNDGGNGWISGSIRIVMPLDDTHLNLIHTTFGSMNNLIHELVKPTVAKVVFASGPLMNSYESYAARRTDFIRFIEDQLRYGVYKTVSKEVKTTDEFTGKEKVIKIAELIENPKYPGGYERQEEAPFERFGLKIAAVSVEQIRYEETIKQQIAAQQKAQMEVQTAIAQTKQQEQQLIQAEKEGEKNATIAKWEQEVIKAKMITEAEQKKEVARLEKEAAEFTKQKEISLGQGESERKRLNMSADGQLAMKLETYERVNQMWANAVANYKGEWVPQTVFGGGTGAPGVGGMNGAQSFMDIMTAMAMQQLNFNANPTK
jgi:regulator of protease activity HflC (stomatin/prohibitin superfamily)